MELEGHTHTRTHQPNATSLNVWCFHKSRRQATSECDPSNPSISSPMTAISLVERTRSKGGGTVPVVGVCC